MKLLIFLLCFLDLSACTRNSSSRTSPNDGLEIAPPTHQKVVLYIDQYVLGPHNGATLRPNLLHWDPALKLKFGTSTGLAGKPSYSATLEYLGKKPAGDVYSISVTHPTSGGFETMATIVTFSGSEIQLFKDDQYKIGLRSDLPAKADIQRNAKKTTPQTNPQPWKQS